MILYTFYDGGDGRSLFATKREALKAAKAAIADHYEDAIEVDRVEVVPLTKANFIEIIETQGGSFVQRRETVAVIRKRRASDHPVP